MKATQLGGNSVGAAERDVFTYPGAKSESELSAAAAAAHFSHCSRFIQSQD